MNGVNVESGGMDLIKNRKRGGVSGDGLSPLPTTR